MFFLTTFCLFHDKNVIFDLVIFGKYLLWIVFLETSRRFDLSSRSIGHVMFYFPGTAQEAGAGGRSGVAGIPVHGSLMGRFSLCIWLLSHFFWSIGALWLALWCCQVKQSVRWHCSGHQHRLVWLGWCVS